MKKLLAILLLIFLFAGSASGQWIWQQKPMLGRQLNRTHPLGNPVAFWYMPEGSGNKVYDLSGNGNTGVLVNTPTWATGKYGSIVDLSGNDSDDHISISKGFVQSAGTLIIRFKVNSINDLDCICTQNGSAEGTIGLGMQYSVTNQIRFFVDQTEVHNNDYTISTNAWYEYAGTWQPSGMAIYENGVQINTNATAKTSSLQAGYTFKIGLFDYSGGQIFDTDMQVDFVSLYNRALSASEISQLYRKPFCMFQPSWNYILYGAISVTVGGQVIIINMN